MEGLPQLADHPAGEGPRRAIPLVVVPQPALGEGPREVPRRGPEDGRGEQDPEQVESSGAHAMTLLRSRSRACSGYAMSSRLPRSFFDRDTLVVARALLGQRLVSRVG